MSQSHLCAYQNSSPAQARELALKQAIFEATMIKKSESFAIEVPNRYEVYKNMQSRFREAVTKTQEKMTGRYPGVEAKTLESTAHTQIAYMAMTDNKIDMRTSLDEKLRLLPQEVKLIERKSTELLENFTRNGEHFKQKETPQAIRNALIHEWIRREGISPTKQEDFVLNASEKLKESLKVYNANIENTLQRQQQRDRGPQIGD